MKIQSYQNPKDGRYYFHITDESSSRQIFNSTGFDDQETCEKAQLAFSLKNAGHYRIAQAYTESGKSYFELLDQDKQSLGKSIVFANSNSMDQALANVRSSSVEIGAPKQATPTWKLALGTLALLFVLGALAFGINNFRSSNKLAKAPEKENTATQEAIKQAEKEPIAMAASEGTKDAPALSKIQQTRAATPKERRTIVFTELSEEKLGNANLQANWSSQHLGDALNKGSISAKPSGELEIKQEDGTYGGKIDVSNKRIEIVSREVRDVYGVRVDMPYRLVNMIRKGMSVETDAAGQTILVAPNSRISYVLGQNLDEAGIQRAKVQQLIWK